MNTALKKISLLLGNLLSRTKRSLSHLTKSVIGIFRKDSQEKENWSSEEKNQTKTKMIEESETAIGDVTIVESSVSKRSKRSKNLEVDKTAINEVQTTIGDVSIGDSVDPKLSKRSISLKGLYHSLKTVWHSEKKTEFIDPAFPSEYLKQKKEEEKEVSVNVYAPPKFQRGKSQFIQVWIFEPKQKEEVKKMAMSMDDEAINLGYKNLLIPIRKGTEITLVLSSKDIAYREQKSLKWMEAMNHENFTPEIPKEYNNDKVIFKLEVFIKDLICGEIMFMMKERIGKEDYGLEPAGEKAIRFKRAFVSYASEDRRAVLERVQGIAATNVFDKLFQDILELGPGERWERRLFQEIDVCDVFFLFWSEAASQSEWVLKELDYAIELKREGQEPLKIQPVILPPRVDPPQKLQHLHFNDRIVQFILAEEHIRSTKKQN